MAFRNYLEGEDDAPYYKLNSLAHYYEEMERYAALIKEMTGYIKDYGNELGLTKEEIDQRVTAYILQNKAQLDQRLGEWDEKLQQFDGSVTDLLAEWVDDGTLNHIIDTTLIDEKIQPLTALLAEKATKQDIANMGSATPKGTYSTLSALQAAFPTGTTGIYIITADGKWYYWNNSAWTAGGVYQSTGIAKNSVTLGTISSKVSEPFNGKELYAKTLGTSPQVYYEVVFDLESITATLGTDLKMRVKYNASTEDSNITGFNSRIFLNNVGTLNNITNAVTFLSPFIANSDLKNTSYDVVRENYVTGNRYAHVFALVEVADTTAFSKYYISNVEFYIGNVKATPTFSGFRDVAAESTVKDVNYLPYQLVRYNEMSKEIKTIVDEQVQADSRLSGSVWNVLGDSLTAVNPTYTTKSYHEYVKEILGLSTVNNYGISGSQIMKYDAGDTKNSMALRYVNMDNNADIITVFGGVNDADYQNPIGTMVDRTVDTFYGACHVLYKGLIEKYPTKKIAIITPLKQTRFTQTRLESYVNVIKEVARFYSLPVLDLFNEGGIQPEIPIIKTTLIPDGLHPNAEGHRIIGSKIAAFLEKL